MPKVILTDRVVKALKADKHPVERYDGAIPGFGVRAMPSGSKSWILVYTRPNGKRRRYTIGTVKASPADIGLSLSDARAEAVQLKKRIADGEDPQIDKKLKRSTIQSDSEKTFGKLIEDWERLHLNSTKRGAEVAATLRRRCHDWLDIPTSRITKADVIAACDEVLAEGHERAARRLFEHIRAIFNWAIKRRGLEIISPCYMLEPPGKNRLRQRTLSETEIKRIWAASFEVGDPFGALVRFLLITGQRRDEAARMTWAEVDLDRRSWVVPIERVKSGRPNIVPLSDLAVETLESLPRYTDGDFVFTTTAGLKPFSGFSGGKERLDSAVLAAEQEMIAGSGDDPERARGIPDWRLHDLRRTCRTGLSALGIQETVAELVLNHDKKGLQAVYNQYEYLEEKRDALLAWSHWIASVIEPNSAKLNVVRFPTDNSRAQ